MMRSSAQACLTTSCKHVRQAVSAAESGDIGDRASEAQLPQTVDVDL